MSIKSKFRKDSSGQSYTNDIDQETLDFINKRSDEIKAEGVVGEFDFLDDLTVKERTDTDTLNNKASKYFDPNTKISFSWKKNKWDVFFLAPVGIFTLITPYFGLYEYLIPFGLHEWAADNFDSFYRSLEAYSSNPMRDKVMYVWGSLFAIVWGVVSAPKGIKEIQTGIYKNIINNLTINLQLGIKFSALSLIMVVFLAFIWWVFHMPSQRKGFKLDDLPMYILNAYLIFFLTISLIGAFTNYMKYLRSNLFKEKL